jgi:hypothetical protein
MDSEALNLWLAVMGIVIGFGGAGYCLNRLVEASLARLPGPSPGAWLAGYRDGRRDSRREGLTAAPAASLTPAQCAEIGGLCRCGYTPTELRAMAGTLDSDPDLIEAEARRWSPGT